MTDVLNVQKREQTGTLRMRRLRKAGKIPAILYGHGEENVSLAVDSREVDSMIRHGSHIVELKGDLNESALVKEVQWNAFGTDVLHLDLSRIDASESVEVSLPVELKGVAPGTKQGGIVKFISHGLEVRCAADKLPDKLELSINHLELEQSLTAGDIELPEGVELVGDATAIVVACVAPTVVEEVTDEGEGSLAEPEVIGRKPDDEEGGDAS